MDGDTEDVINQIDEMEWSFTHIDRHRLDEEWVLQPDKMGEYTRKAAYAREVHAEAKADLAVIEAELSLKIRENPKKYSVGGRATEASIKAAMVTLAKHRRAVRRVNKSKLLLDLLEGAVRTLEHRKSALQDLVVLQGQGYFAKPRVRKEVSEDSRHRLDSARKRHIRQGG